MEEWVLKRKEIYFKLFNLEGKLMKEIDDKLFIKGMDNYLKVIKFCSIETVMIGSLVKSGIVWLLLREILLINKVESMEVIQALVEVKSLLIIHQLNFPPFFSLSLPFLFSPTFFHSIIRPKPILSLSL